jgi:hypothetical protein
MWPHGLRSGPLILASGLGLNSVLGTTHPVLLHHVAKASTRPALPMRPEVSNTPGTGFQTAFLGLPFLPRGPRSGPPILFHLIEVGYCREGFGLQKMEEKKHQHELLRLLLTQTYTSGNALLYHTVTLGVTGAIYNDVGICLKSLGLAAYRRTKTYAHLVHNALNQTHGMVVQRRRLEHTMPETGGQRPYSVKRKRPPDKT